MILCPNDNGYLVSNKSFGLRNKSFGKHIWYIIWGYVTHMIYHYFLIFLHISWLTSPSWWILRKRKRSSNLTNVLDYSNKSIFFPINVVIIFNVEDLHPGEERRQYVIKHTDIWSHILDVNKIRLRKNKMQSKAGLN